MDNFSQEDRRKAWAELRKKSIADAQEFQKKRRQEFQIKEKEEKKRKRNKSILEFLLSAVLAISMIVWAFEDFSSFSQVLIIMLIAFIPPLILLWIGLKVGEKDPEEGCGCAILPILFFPLWAFLVIGFGIVRCFDIVGLIIELLALLLFWLKVKAMKK